MKVKLQKPKAKKAKWEKPKSFKREIQLSSGLAVIRVSFGFSKIDAKIRAVTLPTQVILPKKNGKPFTIPFEVRATFVECTLGDHPAGQTTGTKLKARSCCKPPDKFRRREGIRLAVRHLFRIDEMHLLKGKDRRAIIEELCPELFRRD